MDTLLTVDNICVFSVARILTESQNHKFRGGERFGRHQRAYAAAQGCTAIT